MKKITMTQIQLERLLDNAHTAHDRAEDEWAKNYWTIVIAELLRRNRRLH
jgi:hypothetical protein